MQLKLPAESAPPEQVKHWRVRTTSRYRWGTSGRAVGFTFRHSPPLSFGIVGEAEDEATFGPEDAYDVFSIASGEASPGGVRVAFAARSPEAVDAFHTAALEAGGRDNGAPGSEAPLPGGLLRRPRHRPRRKQRGGHPPQLSP